LFHANSSVRKKTAEYEAIREACSRLASENLLVKESLSGFAPEKDLKVYDNEEWYQNLPKQWFQNCYQVMWSGSNSNPAS
jgi:hypothetical protein